MNLSSSSTTVRQHSHLPEPGTVIAGKYRLVRLVGEGGMGVVFEAQHIRMRQRVAIKMLLPGTAQSRDVVARFEREARASAGLRSRHTARVTDVDQTADGLSYMVMEFLEGQDLGTLLEERRKVPPVEALDYVLQASVAIAEAHAAGIVHRDLKPSNLFLANGPDGRIIKLLDFGISKIVDDTAKLTAAESIMGTPLYMSPEQIRSARDVDARADIWSLGVILYELLAGDPPFSGTTTQVAAAIVTEEIPPILVNHGVSPELQWVVLRALTKDRETRFQTTLEFGAALLPFSYPGCIGALAMEAALRQAQPPTSQSQPMSLPPGSMPSGAFPSGSLKAGGSGSMPAAPMASGSMPTMHRSVRDVPELHPRGKRLAPIIAGGTLAALLLGGIALGSTAMKNGFHFRAATSVPGASNNVGASGGASSTGSSVSSTSSVSASPDSVDSLIAKSSQATPIPPASAAAASLLAPSSGIPSSRTSAKPPQTNVRPASTRSTGEKPIATPSAAVSTELPPHL